MYVYTITNNINNKVYVGLTKCYETRWRQHRQTYLNQNHSEYEKVLYRAFRKYGITNFTFKVIHCDLDVAQVKASEIEAIDDLNSLTSQDGYNVTPGGDLVEPSRVRKGEESYNSKLSDKQALDIITRRDNGELQKAVYADYSDVVLFSGGFQSIWAGNSWKHLQPATIAKRHGRRFLTDCEVRDIRTKVSTKDQSQKSLSKQYGVPTSTISNIINHKTYKDVT